MGHASQAVPSGLAAAALTPSLRAQARTDRQVIVISIDGFPAYAFTIQRSLPTIQRLARRRDRRRHADSQSCRYMAKSYRHGHGRNACEHGVLFNGMPVRSGEGKPLRVEPWVPKHELVLAPTVYDLAHAAGLTTAEVDWVAIHQPKTITGVSPSGRCSEDAVLAR